MSQTDDPKHWWDVYNGDEECRFFKALSRGMPGTEGWRTTDGLAKSAKLTDKRVEEIASHYVKQGLVQTHSSEAGKWRYWERAKPKKSADSLAKTNQKKRVEEAKAAQTP